MAELSVIVISPDGFCSVKRLLDCLSQQSVCTKLELVCVFPEATEGRPDEGLVGNFENLVVITVPDMESTSLARAAGIRAASAPLVVLTEDHSLPEPGWAEALIGAFRRGWVAVGPAVKNGNPASMISWANFAIEYGEWMFPLDSRESSHIPGHNSSYRRDVLLEYGDELESWLEAESVMHWDLRARGHRVGIESGAVTRHHNFSLLGPSLELRYNAGRQFAGMCRMRWTLARRLLYFFGSPLIPFVRTWRIVRQLKKTGRQSDLLPRLIPVSFFMLCVESAGAAIGFLAGPGNTGRYIAKIDFHRERNMNESDRRKFGG